MVDYKLDLPFELNEILKKTVNNQSISKSSPTDRKFLWAMINSIKGKKILELGPCFGSSTAIILNAIKHNGEAILHSVDILSEFPYSSNPQIPYCIEEYFPELKKQLRAYTGEDISEYIEKIGGDIDFAFIDTGHFHPCEALNLITILPFMRENSWVVMHDIGLFYCQENHYQYHNCYATKYIWDAWEGEKLSPSSCELFVIPNIGAIKVENIKKNKKKLLSLLFNHWNMDVPEKILTSVRKIIEKYYDKDELDYFDLIINRKKFLANVFEKNANKSENQTEGNFVPSSEISTKAIHDTAGGITVIIRSSNERTEELCVKKAKEIFGDENVFLVKNVTPFSKAVEESYRIGIEKNKKWTFIVDADVILDKEKIHIFFEHAEAQLGFDPKLFCIAANVFDNLFQDYRVVGAHLYQTAHLTKGLEFIWGAAEELRPETYVKNNMNDRGFTYYAVNVSIGIHDFFQNYEDLVQKVILHSCKHDPSKLLLLWQKLLPTSKDFTYALIGHKVYKKNKDKKFIVDKNYMRSLTNNEDIAYDKQNILTEQEVNQKLYDKRIYEYYIERRILKSPAQIENEKN